MWKRVWSHPAAFSSTPDMQYGAGDEMDVVPCSEFLNKGVDMNAVVFHGAGDIRLEDVPEPELQSESDAIVRITATAICERDLHTVAAHRERMAAGAILGHEAVGIVERAGANIGNFHEGDRVVIPATVACGTCDSCHNGNYSQCDTLRPDRTDAGPVYFGAPESGINGLHAEFARIPYARVNMVRIPDSLSDEQALLSSDILPTGFFAAESAGIACGETVAVFGCGPVGQAAVASAHYLGARRVIAVDAVRGRLDVARQLDAETVDCSVCDPAVAIREITRGRGADSVLVTTGPDCTECADGANHRNGNGHVHDGDLDRILSASAGRTSRDARLQFLTWAVRAARKCGTVSIVGTYPRAFASFAIGEAMSRNICVHAGTCNHRKYVPRVLAMMECGVLNTDFVLRRNPSVLHATEAYETPDAAERGWVMVDVSLAAAAA